MLEALARCSKRRLFWTLALSYLATLEAVSWITSRLPPCIVEAAKYGSYFAENNECPAPHVVLIVTVATVLKILGHDWIIAISAVVTAAFTGTLWWSTSKLWKAGERHSEKELRAYVYPSVAEITKFDTPSPLVQITFYNSGKTPAYDVGVWATVGAAVYPLENEPEPPSDLNTSSKGNIGPGMPFHFRSGPDRPISEAEKAGLRSGRGALYAYGEVVYRDAFSKQRHTRFCYSYGGKGDVHPQGVMAVYKYWNEAN